MPTAARDDRFHGRLAAAFAPQAGTDAAAFAAALPALLQPPSSSLPVSPARDRTVWGGSGSADAEAVASILSRAEADRSQTWPIPLASAAARVHADGDREGWEHAAFARQQRLSRAVVAAATTLDDTWLSEVLDGVWLLCEQSSWCWPAHDDAFAARGSVLATVTEPYLDLGAGEVVAQLAWTDHVLGEVVEARYPGFRARIRHEARTRVFEPFTRRRDWHWLGLDGDVHNWNPWIHGNVLVAALRLLDGPAERDERAHVVALAVEGLDRYVTALPDDGAIDEGYSYWWNGACRALEALDVLRHATGGVLDATGITALRETVAFPHRVHLGGPWYLNLADGQAQPAEAQPWHALHRAARALGDDHAAAHAASHRTAGAPVADERAGLGRLLRGLTDTAWIEAAPEHSPLPRDVWFPSTEVLLARSTAGTPAGLAVAAKGGHNDEHHNHNDVGSFVVASDGVPVVVDAGRPTYTLQTFGPDRYDIWTMQSGWHNVPVIGGREQGAGRPFAASGARAAISGDTSSFTAEIARAYPGAAVSSWRRTVRLERAPGRVVIEDTWTASAPATHDHTTHPPVVERARNERDETRPREHTTVRMLLAGEVRLSAASAHVTPLDGATPVRIAWPEGIGTSIVVLELDDPMLSSVWGPRLTRLELDVTTRERVAVTVEQDLTNAEDTR
ncbi:heparinase II/III domain-containing protein [Microbacterium cremeum]|uniref:heparinase II/III domain-containing protein n=1 Tax=Microbacterium cremeum TaxID=2782169 RepID=UPI001886C23F|nr:heparinase II/III family protein [Microbacterium cremeum]